MLSEKKKKILVRVYTLMKNLTSSFFKKINYKQNGGSGKKKVNKKPKIFGQKEL